MPRAPLLATEQKELRDLEVHLALSIENNRSLYHNSECRKRVESAMRDDAVGAERLEDSKRRKGEVAPGPDVVMSQSKQQQQRGAAECTHIEEHEEKPEMHGAFGTWRVERNGWNQKDVRILSCVCHDATRVCLFGDYVALSVKQMGATTKLTTNKMGTRHSGTG